MDATENRMAPGTQATPHRIAAAKIVGNDWRLAGKYRRLRRLAFQLFWNQDIEQANLEATVKALRCGGNIPPPRGAAGNRP